jgi:hypothetical protein
MFAAHLTEKKKEEAAVNSARKLLHCWPTVGAKIPTIFRVMLGNFHCFFFNSYALASRFLAQTLMMICGTLVGKHSQRPVCPIMLQFLELHFSLIPAYVLQMIIKILDIYSPNQ